jgi:hypothetical protein
MVSGFTSHSPKKNLLWQYLAASQAYAICPFAQGWAHPLAAFPKPGLYMLLILMTALLCQSSEFTRLI